MRATSEEERFIVVKLSLDEALLLEHVANVVANEKHNLSLRFGSKELMEELGGVINEQFG